RAPRQSALNQASERLALAQASVDMLSARKSALETTYQSARAMLRIARDEDRRHTLQQQLATTSTQLTKSEEARRKAEAAQQQRTELRRQSMTQPITKVDLDKLRKQARELRELQIKSDAVATRLRYYLGSNQQLQLGDTSLTGEGEQLLLTPTV